jgi:hypothetical protein
MAGELNGKRVAPDVWHVRRSARVVSSGRTETAATS